MSYEKFKRNERLEGVFNRAAAKYDTIGPNYFSYYGKRLVEHAKINSKSAVLDIAFGKGASLFPAIYKVGENGQVVGIDFSQEMVRQTHLLICEHKLCNAKVFQMDAEMLDFADNSFDYILCGLSTAFFSDSLRAIDEIYRVLKNAGLKNIEIFTEKKTFYYKDEEEWWNEQWTNATRGLFEHVESIGSDAINTFKEAVLFELMEYKDKHGVRFDAEVIFSFGHKY